MTFRGINELQGVNRDYLKAHGLADFRHFARGRGQIEYIRQDRGNGHFECHALFNLFATIVKVNKVVTKIAKLPFLTLLPDLHELAASMQPSACSTA